MSNGSGTVASVESSSREEKRPRKGILTWGISRSLVDSCLDCRVPEVTVPTHNRKVFWSQHPRCAGVHCHGGWVAHSRATEVGSCAFSCEVCTCGSGKYVKCCRTIFSNSIFHKRHTSFISWCSRPPWSWVIVYAHTTTTKTISPKRNYTTVLCELTKTSLKAPWTSVGFLPRKASILMYGLGSEIITVSYTPAGYISSSC